MMKQIEKLKMVCSAKNYTQRTATNYASIITEFLQWVGERNVTLDIIVEYQCYLKETKKLSSATLRLRASALRFYVANILENKEMAAKIFKVKQESRLPNVLSKEEVKLLPSEHNPAK
jgi:site-specific recombinase XerD